MKLISFHTLFNENMGMISKQLNIPITNDMDTDDLYIVYGAHLIADKLLMRQTKTKYKYVILQTESYKSDVFRNKFYIQLLKQNFVLDYHKDNGLFLKDNFDVNILGYHWFDFPVKNIESTREIDFLFLGTYSERRNKIYEKLASLYPDKKILFNFENNYDNTDALYSNAKCVLNIPFYEHTLLETHRINKALSMGCIVVSLKSHDQYTNTIYDDYIHFVDDITELDCDSPKEDYTKLQIILNQNILQHMRWVLQKINMMK